MGPTSLHTKRYSWNRCRNRRPASCRLSVEQLETRLVPAISFRPAGVYYTGANNTISEVSGDFNRDGAIDLAVVNAGNSSVSVLLGHGDGTFADPNTFTVGTNIVALAEGDFNGDGKLDVVTADQGTNTVLLLGGNGDGTFQAPLSYAAGQYPSTLAVGDLNGDGKPDLAVASAASNTVSVLLNDGAGGFQAPATNAVGSSPQAVAIGDFNGDHEPDLVTANGGSNTVSVLLNQGGGVFGPATDYATGAGPVAVAVGDLNGDGKADLATAGGSAASVLLGNGDGSFQPPATYATNDPVSSIAIADFNQDGKPDLALGFVSVTYSSWTYDTGLCECTGGDGWYWGSSGYTDGCYEIYATTYETDMAAGVSFLEGNGSGVFGPETDVTSNSYSEIDYFWQPYLYETIPALAVGDFDGNGGLDVAAVESFDPVDVLLNNQPRDALQLTGSPAPAVAGVVRSVTVSAFDSAGNPDPLYTGTVRFASTDAQADLPADYTFTAADHGVHTFSVTLKTAGSQSISVWDVTTSSSTTSSVQVTPAAASTLTVTGPTNAIAAGQAASISVEAFDPFGNLATGYTGTVHLSNSDAAATLPANYIFTAADQGLHTFSVTLRTVGPQTVIAADTQAPAITGQTVVGVAPVAAISGPTVGAINQDLTFTLTAAGGASASTIFTYQLDWNGDGLTDQTVSGVSGMTVTHSFGFAGLTSVKLTAGFAGLASAPASCSLNVLPVSMYVEPDSADPTRQALLIDGSGAGSQTIVLSPAAGNSVTVTYNGTALGTMTPAGSLPFAHIVVYGGPGNDVIRLTGGLAVPAVLWGGPGNDTLDAQGSTAANVLLGQAGNDTLLGGSANDILIGGLGSDLLKGNAGDDILIGGTTSYDNDLVSLCALMREWGRTDASYSTRVNHLKGGAGGLNGTHVLTTATVLDDGVTDTLYGNDGLDWFFARLTGSSSQKDRLQDRASNDVLTSW
jgi:hypothetical protein